MKDGPSDGEELVRALKEKQEESTKLGEGRATLSWDGNSQMLTSTSNAEFQDQWAKFYPTDATRLNWVRIEDKMKVSLERGWRNWWVEDS